MGEPSGVQGLQARRERVVEVRCQAEEAALLQSELRSVLQSMPQSEPRPCRFEAAPRRPCRFEAAPRRSGRFEAAPPQYQADSSPPWARGRTLRRQGGLFTCERGVEASSCVVWEAKFETHVQ